MEAIRAHQLLKTFEAGTKKNRRTIEAVRNLDLTVEQGERVAYIGPNGAGKSTSIKIFTGILHPTGGEAEVLGLVPWKQRRQLAKRIGTLFGQRSQLWSELTARQGLRLLGAIYGLDRDAAHRRSAEVAELLDATELLDQQVRGFSLGQRMRCELAASMMHQPELLFLDEPTIGLDLVAKRTFRTLVSRLNAEQGTTIFLTSHDVADIEAVAQRVIVINHGHVIYDDSVASLRSSLLATKLVDIRFDRPVDAVDVSGAEIIAQTADSCSLRIDTRLYSVRATLDAVLDRYPVADISVNDPPLEDVIGEIYAGRL